MPLQFGIFFDNCPDYKSFSVLIADAYGMTPPFSNQESYRHLEERTHDDLFQNCVDASRYGPGRHYNIGTLTRAYIATVARFVTEGLLPEPQSGVTSGGKTPHAYAAACTIMKSGGLSPKINPNPQHHQGGFYTAAGGHHLAEWLSDHFS